MPSRREYPHGGIRYLHEEYTSLGGIIWPVPELYDIDDTTDYGFEVLHERTLRFGTKAYELAELHARILNAVLQGSLVDRYDWVPHDLFYKTLNQPRPVHPTYVHRALEAYDGLMCDATGIATPFIERARRGTGYPIRLRLNPQIGLEDRRKPRDYDIPFD